MIFQYLGFIIAIPLMFIVGFGIGYELKRGKLLRKVHGMRKEVRKQIHSNEEISHSDEMRLVGRIDVLDELVK